MLIALFALSVSVLVFLLLYGILAKKIRPQSQVQQRIRRMQADKEKAAPLDTARRETQKFREIPFVDRVVRPAVQSLEESLAGLAPQKLTMLLANRIAMAGKSKQWSANELLFASALGALLMGGMLFLLVWDLPYQWIQKIMFTLLGTLMGGIMPSLFLNIAIKKRQAAIQSQLPEVLDLLCVSVQAGLSFDASLRKITGRMRGPFVEECQRMQEDIRMGMGRRTAMHNVSKRCKIQDVSLFMTSLIQAEQLGNSMGKTLKNQADNIRERRRQYVKAEAMKAPVKIIFPLVFFIFPALFVVVLIPSLLSLMKNM